MNPFIASLREKAGRHRLLIGNFSYLSALQVINLILPLATYPYLIRVLGKELYGLVVFAQAAVGYLRIVLEFGFNISATKAVSIHRDKPSKLSEVVSSVLILKTALFVLSMAVILLLPAFIPQAKEYRLLLVLSMWVCLYELIFPSWYFQGTEKMKFITWITLVSRLIALGLVFMLIRTPADYLLYPVVSGIGATVAGLISLYIIFGRHRITLIRVPLPVLKRYFTEAVPIFISNLSVQLYLSAGKILVGLFLGLSEVAYYDLGEKILNLFKMPLAIFTQAVFPQVSARHSFAFVKKAATLLFLATLAAIVLFQAGAGPLVVLFAGADMLPAANVARILTLSLLPMILSNALGIQSLLALGFNRDYSAVVLYGTLSYFTAVAILLLSASFTIYTISLVSILTELVMLAGFYRRCKKRHLIRN